jgi:predicted RNA-binding protein
MCESKVYLFKEGKEELILDDVSYLCPEQEGVLLQNVFGEQRWIKARIKEMYLLDYRIILEEY